MNGCPSPIALLAFLNAELPTSESTAVSTHLDQCTSCQELTNGLSDDPELRQWNELYLSQSPVPSIDQSKDGKSVGPVRTAPSQNGRTDSKRITRLGQLDIYESPIGHGGMSLVFKAFHRKLKRFAAFKVLLPQRTTDRTALKRFNQEMALVGNLNHPNIVRAFDAGEINSLSYFVTEYIDGPCLAHMIQSQGQLSVPVSCEIARQIALALEHVHQRGLVHRDVKPSNILLTGEGTAKLADLGISCFADPLPNETKLTSTGVVPGTVDYLPPEQATKKSLVDGRSDLYSLGCTLYHCIVGKPPFSGSRYDTDWKKLAAHANVSPAPIRNFRDDVPQDVIDLIDRLLDKVPVRRAAGSGAVAKDLQRWSSPDELTSMLQSTDWLPPETMQSAGTAELAQEVIAKLRKQSSARRGRWLSLATVAGLLVAVAVVVVFITHVPNNQTPRVQTPAANVPFRDLTPGEIVDKKWYSLLNTAPEKLWWDEGSRKWPYSFDPKAEQVHFETFGLGMLELGNTHRKKNYTLRIDISQTNPGGKVGMFHGYHRVADNQWRFQLLHFQSRTDPADKTKIEIRLYRSIITVTKNEAGGISLSPFLITSVPVKQPDRRAMTLQIDVIDANITNIRWGGSSDRLKVLWTIGMTPSLKEITPDDYSGSFGIYSFYGTATFEQAQIKLF